MIRAYRRFTLVELLVVIAIIAVLAGLLMPAIFGVRVKAKEAKARAEIKSLQTALAQYETTYGYLPWGGTSDTLLSASNGPSPAPQYIDSDYHKVISILQNHNWGNARGIRFLDVVTEQGPGYFRDPWGNHYRIMLDLNYDGQVSVGSTDVYQSAAIWSYGRDEQNDSGQDDDINSWKE